MFSLVRDFDYSTGKTTYTPVKGLSVKVSGISENTREKGDCGSSGISDLADNNTLNLVGTLKGF